MKFKFFKKKQVSDSNSLDSKEQEEVVENSGTTFKAPRTCRQILVKQLKDNILLILTVISVIFGIGLGFILRAKTNFSPPVKAYFGFPGEIFLRSLKFLILPLISSSLITGIAGLGTQKTGKVAARALIFYFCSTFSAVVVGLILVSTIKPGYLNRNTEYKNKIDPLANQKVNTIDTLFDLVR